MAQTYTLEGIKGGGGSIKVGTVGTISSLMTRELEQQISSTPHKQSSHFGLPLSEDDTCNMDNMLGFYRKELCHLFCVARVKNAGFFLVLFGWNCGETKSL